MSNPINYLNIFLQYPFKLLASSNGGHSLALCAGIGLTVLGAVFLYRHSSTSRKTNLRDYVIVTPFDGAALIDAPPESERRKLYDQAKKVIHSLPADFTSKVDFNDRELEIGFRYDQGVLARLASHEKLWFIFSQNDSFEPICTRGTTIFDSTSKRFSVKNHYQSLVQLNIEREVFAKKAKNYITSEATVKFIPNFYGIKMDNYSDLLSSVFEKSKGVSLGEGHRQIAMKYFLISQMRALIVDHHVETFFLEGLTESVQADLDAYFNPKTDLESIPLSIRYFFGYLENTLQSAGGYTWIDLIKTAKKEKLKRIVGIDTELSFLDENNENIENRMFTMNYYAQSVINREMPKGKYIIVSGLDHSTHDRIPGFSQLFGIPSIFIHDGHMRMILNTQNKTSLLPIGKEKVAFHADFDVAIPLREAQKPKT